MYYGRCANGEFPTPETLRGIGTSFRRTQRFLGSFEWTSITYDWLMVVLNTIDQSELTLVHPNDPRNHCTQS